MVTITPITTVGEMGFMTNHRRPTSLEAVEQSRVVILDKDRFATLLKSDVGLHVRCSRT